MTIVNRPGCWFHGGEECTHVRTVETVLLEASTPDPVWDAALFVVQVRNENPVNWLKVGAAVDELAKKIAAEQR